MLLFALAAGILLAGGLAAVSVAKMKSERLERKLCVTKGGGKFVGIPGFRGEKIDRRLKRDVRYLKRRYKILVTDGYSLDPVHSANGEHPIGLALDIVPNRAKGGNWRKIGKLARWAEPRQDQPRAPFRWVGYKGDAGHGRGHHLHLSWSHSDTRYNKPARTVYSIKCPRRKGGGNPGDDGTPKPDPSPSPDPAPPASSGGVSPSRGYSPPRGGISPAKRRKAKREIRRQQSTRSSVERDGAESR